MKTIEDKVLGILFRSSEPVRTAAIEEGLRADGLEINRRTVIRALTRLMESGQIQRTGNSVASSYAVIRSGLHLNAVPYSEASTRLMATVSRHVSDKRIVGYNQSFLDGYVPNETRYLPERFRVQMHEMGRMGGEALPAGTYHRDILERLIIDLSWASSSLEGNRYSRIDTRDLILHRKVAEGADAQETAMILNHKAAIEMLVEDGTASLTPYFFRSLHSVLSEDLMPDPAASGRLRRRPVEISGSAFVPLAIPQKIEENFETILKKAEDVEDPFEAALFLMVHIPYLQPFEDVNKRTSRLGANIPLIQARLSPLSFIGMPEEAYIKGTQAVYEMNRVDLLAETFFYAYEKSCQRYAAVVKTVPQPDPVKLEHRGAVKQAVRDVVLNETAPDLTTYLPAETPPEVAGRFVEIVQEEIATLHEGNIARYWLRPSDLESWKAREENSRGDLGM